MTFRPVRFARLQVVHPPQPAPQPVMKPTPVHFDPASLLLDLEDGPEYEPAKDTGPGVDTMYALSTGRKTYYQQNLDQYERLGITCVPHRETPEKSNLLSSEVEPDKHLAVIDCDYPVIVMESSTPGHGHLYIEKEMTWEQYKALLEGMFKAGLIQKAWYENALKDKRTYVRLPHVKKPRKKA